MTDVQVGFVKVDANNMLHFLSYLYIKHRKLNKTYIFIKFKVIDTIGETVPDLLNLKLS